MKIVIWLAATAGGLATLYASAWANTGYAAGSKLSVSIACPTSRSSDPTFSFTLTNRGAAPVEVDQQIPISVMVHLTVKNSKGDFVQPGYYNSGTRSLLLKPKLLEPGQSLVLEDWVDFNKPRTSDIPIHVFGYNLSPGNYAVSARATDDPDERQSNVCQVSVK